MTPSSSPQSPAPRPSSRVGFSRLLWIAAGVVLAWFALAEVASYGWYGSQEAKLEKNPLPETGEMIVERLQRLVESGGTPVKEQDIGDAAMEMLKCSYGRTLIWPEAGAPVAVTTLKWSEGSVVGGVEGAHNPGNCLRAAGWKIGAKTDLGVEEFCGASGEVVQWEVSQGNLRMVAFSAVFRRFTAEPLPKERSFWNAARFRSVLAGRRDAPVLILLAYLPNRGGPADVRAHFQRLMRGVFCAPSPETAALP